MKQNRISWTFLALFLMIAPAWAQGEEEVFNAITGDRLVEILQSQGFAASLTVDRHGDPLVLAEAGGVHFQVITYGCNGAANPSCSRLQMVSQMRLPNGATEADIAMMNAYNQRFLFGRAYLDAYGQATVDYSINLNQGISEDNLIDNLNIWTHVLFQFVNGLGWSVSS